MKELKTCTRCKESKEAISDNFGFNKNRNKLKGHCKDCGNLWARTKYDADREEILARDRARARERYKDPEKRAKKQELLKKWFEAHPEKKKEYAKRKKFRAMANKNPLTQEWVQILYKDPCFYCGKSVEAIDHNIPTIKGGTDDVTNITGICHNCNSSKGTKNLLEYLVVKQKELSRIKEIYYVS